jgi:ABC-2 type transport system ATP-binding protein
MTGSELLAYSARFYGIRDNSRIAGLAERFELDLEKKFRELSLGNRKKVSIIQALLHSPELLVMDEPTMGLDPLMQKRFFDILDEQAQKGTTVFFSSHTLSDVQDICSRVAIIKAGRIIKTADMAELLARQVKKVTVDFESAADPTVERLPGVTAAETRGNRLSFTFSGDYNKLLEKLSRSRIKALSVTEPELMDIFLEYYGEGDAG